MKENTTKFVLLGLLSRRPLTGYDIKKTVETRLDYVWDLSNGQIYPTLKTMEKEGLITKKVETRENGPIRKIYSITKKGFEELTDWLNQPAHPEINRYEILLKLMFGEHADPETNSKHIQDFKRRNTQLYEAMSQFERNLDGMPVQTEEAFYVRLAVLLGKSISKASIDWAEKAIQMLEEHKAGE
ncbi:MAG: PadR family transcriptional regulator [Candidatus Bathyarchaeota archaeon]|nr:PadR family transcriptional regulator [Candidatus Bathyarchaeota archaeon]